jgi:hypothetical protein
MEKITSASWQTARFDFHLDDLLHPAQAFEHPRRVVEDRDLTLNEKRAILASWASDACAIEAPALRQAPGTEHPVRFDDVMKALRMLDQQAGNRHSVPPRYRRIMRAVNRAPFGSNNRDTGTADENKAVAQGTISHFGTYMVDEAGKTIDFRIEGIVSKLGKHGPKAVSHRNHRRSADIQESDVVDTGARVHPHRAGVETSEIIAERIDRPTSGETGHGQGISLCGRARKQRRAREF